MEAHPLLAQSELVSDRTPRPLIAPMLMFDLQEEARLLHGEWPWDAHGHNARTLLKNPDCCLVQISMKSGAAIPEQQVALRLVIQVLSGELSVAVCDTSMRLRGTQLLAIEPNMSHSIAAVTDSEFLLWLVGRSAHPDPQTVHSTREPA